MKLGIMQPYLFPYVGYFQLINAVDEFVVYDNIQYTKKGWINRNRVLVNGEAVYISVPIKKDSDFLDVNKRELAETWPTDRQKLLNRIKELYRKAEHFGSTYPVIQQCLLFEGANLFDFIYNSIDVVCDHLGISTELHISSSIDVNHSLKAAQKVMGICKAMGASTYINPIGGVELYEKDGFSRNGIELVFLESNRMEYKQFANGFVSSLSIIDVMMFNSLELIRDHLDSGYRLI